MRNSNRRQFLQECALVGGTAFALNAAQSGEFLIESTPEPSFHRRLAERELLRGLASFSPLATARLAEPGERVKAGDLFFRLRVDPNEHRSSEACSIRLHGADVYLTGASEKGLLYAVFNFLERQGAYFGIDGESYPIESAASLMLPTESQVWKAAPRFAVRGLLPWPDFLNCISVYNDEDFQAYFEAMLRMRLNMFGMHVYSSPTDTESYLSFDFAGAGHTGYLDNSASGRWGYLPARTSSYGMGAPAFFDGEVFGSDATILSRNPWEIAARTRTLLRNAFAHAKRLGIATGIGFEPYQLPDGILRALPPEALPKPGKRLPGGAAFDVESVTSRKLLEARLGELLDAYPDVDYVWLWEDEAMNWESRKTHVPLSVTPFQQAYDFLKRNAPKKRMVLSGWGGVVRHFEYFHQKLPMDVVFSCLNDSLGWDPVSDVFGKLEGRERWPIPWLEDDPAMWLPQFHVNRTQRDIELAAKYGCQGVLGIHWRHRIMDPTAGYLARSTWDASLSPATHYANYARSQASETRASKLGEVLNDMDLHQKLLHTGTDQVDDGHVVTHEWAGDYSEGFLFWHNYEPEERTVVEQRGVAAALRELADNAQSPVERERIGYLAGFLAFAVPYTDAWTTAHHLHTVLEDSAKLKDAGHADEAKSKVMADGLPLWLKLAPLVRETMVQYQSIIATRPDLGQLSSMHDKYVRLALHRLPLSMQEYLGDIPSSVQQAFRQAIQPNADGLARLFIPTRPTMLNANGRFRIMIVALGPGQIEAVTLHTRLRGSPTWNHIAAMLKGRNTYEALIGPFDPGKELAAYYVSAQIQGVNHFAPLGAPEQPYFITLI